MTRHAIALPTINPRTATPAQWAQLELALTRPVEPPTPAHICHDDTDTTEE
jgi:hypothetical protein